MTTNASPNFSPHQPDVALLVLPEAALACHWAAVFVADRPRTITILWDGWPGA
ncbi:MAG: hypothetical protein JO272_10510 [Pseudonocardiales bacterium]|nr:hypothetical protein [Pseudonocardiales bacterium]